jgi:hypothetical protein
MAKIELMRAIRAMSGGGDVIVAREESTRPTRATRVMTRLVFGWAT